MKSHNICPECSNETSLDSSMLKFFKGLIWRRWMQSLGAARSSWGTKLSTLQKGRKIWAYEAGVFYDPSIRCIAIQYGFPDDMIYMINDNQSQVFGRVVKNGAAGNWGSEWRPFAYIYCIEYRYASVYIENINFVSTFVYCDIFLISMIAPWAQDETCTPATAQRTTASKSTKI